MQRSSLCASQQQNDGLECVFQCWMSVFTLDLHISLHNLYLCGYFHSCSPARTHTQLSRLNRQTVTGIKMTERKNSIEKMHSNISSKKKSEKQAENSFVRKWVFALTPLTVSTTRKFIVRRSHFPLSFLFDIFSFLPLPGILIVAAAVFFNCICSIAFRLTSPPPFVLHTQK